MLSWKTSPSLFSNWRYRDWLTGILETTGNSMHLLFLSASPGGIVVKASLMWNNVQTVLYNLTICHIILVLCCDQNDVMFFFHMTYFPYDVNIFSHRLIEKDCQMCWIVFFTVKTYQNQIIIFSLRFLLAQSCTYGAGWCFVCTIRLLSTCCFQVASLGKLKIFCAFRATFGKYSNPETLKLLLVCFA